MPKKTAADLRLSRPPRAPRVDQLLEDDLAPDVFAVTWDATRTTVVVTHYPDRWTKRACCTITGHVTADDRAQRSAEVPAEVYTLRRLRMPCGVDDEGGGGSPPHMAEKN
jgi:hypothetical protein